MSTFSLQALHRWKQAADELGFALIAPYELRAATGATVSYAALLPEFGSEHGMLVIIERDDTEAIRNAREQGFGYSVLSDDSADDRDGFVEMLCDWGWASKQPPPEWYAELLCRKPVFAQSLRYA